MPTDAEFRRYLVLFLTVVMFLAGFALADTLLFKGETMPAVVAPFAGWLVCGATGVYVALLFGRRNNK